MNEKNNFSYNIRHTGWGRFLSGLLIVLISLGIGFLSFYQFGRISKDKRLEKYIDNSIYSIAKNNFQENPNIDYGKNFFDYNFHYVETENGKEKEEAETTVRTNIDKTEDIDKLFNKKDYLFFIKGEYVDNKISIEKNTLNDENLTKKMEKILNKVSENTETIVNENYISVNSEEFSERKFDEINNDTNTEQWVEYNYDDSTGDINGATIYENIDKTSNMKTFQIGLSNENFNNNLFIKYPVSNVLLYGLLPAAILMAILFFIFDTLSKYNEYKERPIIRIFRKTPVEIKIAILGTFIPVGITIMVEYLNNLNNLSYLNIMDVNRSYISAVFLVSLGILFEIFSLRFLVLWIKELYNDGFKDTVVKYSLIAMLWRFIKKIFFKIVNGTENKVNTLVDDVGTMGTAKIIGLTVGIILAALLLGLTLSSGIGIIIAIIMGIVIYKLIYSVVKNIKNINDVSEEISKGNYDIKVDEDLPYFKNIAHNFNTIGDNLTKAVEEQVKAERMRTELITNVSHDLKTPLTSIINYSKILIDEKSTQDEKEEYAKIIYEKALKLKILIEDLFQISKASSNSIEFEKEKIDFSALTLQGVGEWKDYFEEKGLDIVYNKPDYPIVLNLDGNRTYRVIDNLMGNIYKYAQEGTRVYMDINDSEKTVKLTIKNISAYELNITSDELIERFARGDRSRNTDGSGLGLSIASSLIKGQGGKFNIDIDGDLFKVTIEFNK